MDLADHLSQIFLFPRVQGWVMFFVQKRQAFFVEDATSLHFPLLFLQAHDGLIVVRSKQVLGV